MAVSVTSLTVLPTARPWQFAAIGASAGSGTSHAGYNANKTDGTGAGGSSGLNSAYAYGQQHSTAGETNPHTVAVAPGSMINIIWTSGTAKADSGSTLYGPHGNIAGTTGLSPTADYTDSGGYVHPTNGMPASKNLSGNNPTLGRMGLCGCFTDYLGNIIPNSFWDFRSKATLGFLVTQCTTASGGNSTYTGVFLGGANNGLAGMLITVYGMSFAVNNGTFLCSASTGTTMVLPNGRASAQSTQTATALIDRIAFVAPQDPSTAYISMGINDTVLYDNGGTGFSVTVGVLDAMTVALQGDPPAFKRYPFGVINCALTGDQFNSNIFMATTPTPQYDFRENGFNKEHTGQLYPSGPPIRGSGQVYP